METQTADLSCRGGPYSVKCLSLYLVQKAGLTITVLLIQGFVDRALLAAHQAQRIAAPWMEGNFAQSAKDKRECKAEGGKKRDHIGSCERKGRGQRAGGWRKGGNMKNKTRESAIVRENLFRCFPGCSQSEQDIVFTLCMLPHTLYQVRMAGVPLQDPWQQLDQCQKETNLLNPHSVHRVLKLFLRAWWRVRIELHWVWAYVEGNGISNKQKWASFISEAQEINSQLHHDRDYSLALQKHPRGSCTRDLLSGDAVDHFYRLAG